MTGDRPGLLMLAERGLLYNLDNPPVRPQQVLSHAHSDKHEETVAYRMSRCAARNLVVNAFGVVLDLRVDHDLNQVATKDVVVDAPPELRK